MLPVANDVDNAVYVQVQKHEQFGNTSEAEERKEYFLYRIVIRTRAIRIFVFALISPP